MARLFWLALYVCLAGAAPALAGDVDAADDPPLRTDGDADWQSFDELVTGAKRAMLADPAGALQQAHVATEFAERHGYSARQRSALATSLLLEAEALSRLNHVDDARVVLQRATTFAGDANTDPRFAGDMALSIARIAESKGDFALALQNLHRAHNAFVAANDARGQAVTLQGLGSLYEKAHDYEHEIEYYRRAGEIYSGDRDLDFTAINNTAFAKLQLGRYGDAIAGFRRALAQAYALKSPFLEARVLTNLAAAYIKTDQLEAADAAADQALRSIGRNDWSRFVWGAKAEIAFERDRLDDADAYLGRAFRGVDDMTSTILPFRDLHRVAFDVYNARGEYPLAIEHLQAFKRLDDEARSLSASANLALNGAHFDFSTQQTEIERLKTATMQRDISLRESRVATQKLIYTSLILLCVILVIVVSARSIAARKHRAQMAEANEALRETLDERDREIARRAETEHALRTAKELSEQANRAKGEFLANMSHELRTPLNAIIGFSEIIAQEALGAVGNPNYKGYAVDITNSGRHLLSILNDILDMARIEAGKLALDEENVVLDDMIADSLRLFDDVMAAGKRIQMVPAASPIRVRADARKLKQIVINLISNAVKFTAPTGAIEIRLTADKNGADIVVRDNGVGIPEDKIAHVLEPFGQVQGTFVRSTGGVGLGLPIVKSLIEMHGGAFTLTSKAGEGTTARVHLPGTRVLPSLQGRAALAS